MAAGIYVHTPFCVKKCLYCDFLSFRADEKLMDRYLAALCTEIGEASRIYGGQPVSSIYFGGGTPSLPGKDYIPRIMDVIRGCFDVLPDAEITVEVNPGTIGVSGITTAMSEGVCRDDTGGDKLEAFIRAGVNRLSIGLQSVWDEELQTLGRIHSFREFVNTYESARKAGFDNISVDLIRGIPHQTADSFRSCLERVLDLTPLPPEHISVYGLIVEENTPFHEMYADGSGLPDEEEEQLMSNDTERLMAEHGYRRYEISNYAIKGYECDHNIRYWRRGDYYGFGIGAASLTDNGTIRYHNTSDIDRYLNILERLIAETNTEDTVNTDVTVPCDIEGRPRQEEEMVKDKGPGQQNIRSGITALWEDYEELTQNARMEEFMFLGLRMTDGISTADFRRSFGCDIDDIYGEVIDRYEKAGVLVRTGPAPSEKMIRRDGPQDDERICLTARGLEVSNTILADFLLD